MIATIDDLRGRVSGYAVAILLLTVPLLAAVGQAVGTGGLTGGEGRIARGLEVLRQGWAPRMLVSGVDREVRPREFLVEHKVPRRLMACCVTLGFESVDTRSNAREAAQWIARNRFRSVRLVTTDWHMRRAELEMEQMLPGNVTVIRDAVRSQPSFRILFLEYHKLLARAVARLGGG